MKVSRREFVSTASCAAAASLCALPSSALAMTNSGKNTQSHCTLLDLESNCTLPESLAGMQSALGDLHHRLAPNDLSSIDVQRTLIVAAAGAVDSEIYGVVA